MYFWHQETGLLKAGRPFTLKGVRYPVDWLTLSTEAERLALGIKPTTVVKPDSLYYDVGAEIVDSSESTVAITYAKTAKSIEVVRKQKLSDLAAHRWKVACGGTTINGNVFKTDDSSANEIDTALRQIERGQLTPPVKFTSSTSGNFLADQATLQAILNGIVTHRQKARAAEYAHTSAINALSTSEEVIAYDFKIDIVGSEWPTNPV